MIEFDVASEDRTIPGPEGAPDIRVRIYRPEEAIGMVLRNIEESCTGLQVISDQIAGLARTAVRERAVGRDAYRPGKILVEKGLMVDLVHYRELNQTSYVLWRRAADRRLFDESRKFRANWRCGLIKPREEMRR